MVAIKNKETTENYILHPLLSTVFLFRGKLLKQTYWNRKYLRH